MQFFDHNTDHSRIPVGVRPFVRGLLSNTQKFDEDADAPNVTQAIKYYSERQDRRQTSSYDGTNPFVQEIIDIFEFPPLDFQVESWETVQELDAERRDPDAGSKAALFEAPTGFGKTESFLGPVYKMLRDNPDETTVLVYPRTALLQNQLERVLKHLHSMRGDGPSELSVGVYVGNMPYEISDVETNWKFFDSGHQARFKLANCWCGTENESHAFEYHGSSNTYTLKCENNPEHKFTDRELMLSRKDISQNPPNILLTTLESLELFALKPNYSIIEDVSTIVLDEVHLYTGLRGAHAANIIQNINEITAADLLWLGASATVDNPARFAKKLFGLQGTDIKTVRPPDSDFNRDHNDYEHYYFLMSPEDGPGASSMLIQQLMLLGHSLLDDQTGRSGKILSFIDSISQVNQKHAQLVNADHDRELWRYHIEGDGYENWRLVADEMGYSFNENPLSLLRVYSDEGFDVDAAMDSDVLLSTSFLEVGIDVGDISVISQYRTPQGLSSFVQRTGRAARNEGMDSHILTFLSNLTGDANMFYRAERFLTSDLRTPLKADNDVVAWIHDQLLNYYQSMTRIRQERYRSERIEERKFYETFLKGDDGLNLPQFYEFLTDPGTFLDDEFGIGQAIDQPLISEPYLNAVQSVLEKRDEQLRTEFEELNDYIDTDGNEIIRAEDAFDEYLNHIRQQILEQLGTYRDVLGKYEEVLDTNDDQSRSDDIESVSGSIAEYQTRVERYRSLSKEERVEQYNELIAELPVLAAELKSIRAPADCLADEQLPDIKLAAIDDLQAAVDRLAGLAGDKRLERLSEERRQLFYLQEATKQLFSYRGLAEDSTGTPRKPYLSVWYVKYLLRAAYYFNRFLAVDGRANAKDVWYVPPNYFESSGQYFTIFQSPADRDGKEASLDSIVHTHAPYRSEYQADSAKSRLFMPETEVIESSSEETPSRVAFDFSSIPTDDRPNMRIPESITLQEVTDLTDESAQNIVRYCPECLQIIDSSSCLLHNDSALGKIHSDPQVSTVARNKNEEASLGGLSLCELSGEVTLEGVTLNITPAEYHGPAYGYGWADKDRIEREIESKDPPLGFALDTRGLVLDLSSFIEGLDDGLADRVSTFKDLDQLSLEELAYHTAAHFLLQVTADIGGINTSMLFYGIDKAQQEVFVFERIEGGQGITDLVYDELEVNPGHVLTAMNQTAFNPQVLNERLWAQESVIDAVPTDGPVDETAARDIVSDSLDVSYAGVIDRVVQEFITTTDRCVQLADDENGVSIDVAHQIKHEIAQAQLEGETELPTDRLETLDASFDIDTVESLFVSPDIDGCVENLHLSECMSGHSQEESLSYILLERLYDQFTTKVEKGDATEFMFDSELLPAADLDGTNVFLTF